MRRHVTMAARAAALAALAAAGTTMADDWRAEADRRIDEYRKGDFAVTCVYANGKPVAGAKVRIRQTRSSFHFGTCIGGDPFGQSPDEKRYTRYILDHFNALVCENAMKWYATERTKDKLTFDDADRLMKFAEANGLAMRGHCLFWSKPKYVQAWVRQLTNDQLRRHVEQHIADIVPRWRGRLVAWDVNNEMLDGSFYAGRLGESIRAEMFKRAHELDPCTPLFVNEYGVLCNDEKLGRYAALIGKLRKAAAPVGGIGVQEHAAQRFAAALRGVDANETRPERQVPGGLEPRAVWRRLDRLGQFGLPIHITEVSSKTPDERLRAETLETFLRVAYAHPKVEAFLLWGFWARRHWLGPQAALVEADWKPNAAGRAVSKLLLEEWRTNLEATTDAAGVVRFRGFAGTYELTTATPGGTAATATVTLPRPGPARVVLQRTRTR